MSDTLGTTGEPGTPVEAPPLSEEAEIDRVIATNPVDITEGGLNQVIVFLREARPKFLQAQKAKKVKAEIRSGLGVKERKSLARTTTLTDLGLLPTSTLEPPAES